MTTVTVRGTVDSRSSPPPTIKMEELEGTAAGDFYGDRNGFGGGGQFPVDPPQKKRGSQRRAAVNLFLLAFVSLSAVCGAAVAAVPHLDAEPSAVRVVRVHGALLQGPAAGQRHRVLPRAAAGVRVPRGARYLLPRRAGGARLGRASTPGVLLARGENAGPMRLQTDRGAAAALARERARRSKGVQVLREAGIAWFVVAALLLPPRARLLRPLHPHGRGPAEAPVVPATFEGAKCFLSLLLPFGDGGGNDACTGNRSEEEVERDSGAAAAAAAVVTAVVAMAIRVSGLLGSLFGDGGS